MSNLRRRLRVVEEHVDQGEMSGEKVRAARRRWIVTGELPAHPRLRAIVEQINQSLVLMNASMNVYDDETTSTMGTP